MRPPHPIAGRPIAGRTRAFLAASLLIAAGALAGCAGGAGTTSPDDRYGHRYEGRGPDGRETMLLEPAADSAEVFVYPAVLDTVHVRMAASATPAGTAVPVEVLLKGALPEACATLDEATQERAGHLLRVTLTMRRPRGVMCAQVVRPFRFYLPLEGTFEPGSYTLVVNDVVRPFRIREGALEQGADAQGE